jgi:phosphatidylinositol glycan class K
LSSAIGLKSTSTHNNNWAVILSTSKYFFNYRHNSNALTIYKMVKELGIPDSQIILMLPDDVACSPRNPVPATVFNHQDHARNLYDADNIEVDYRGEEVSPSSFLGILTGRHAPDTPLSKRLMSDDKSNVFVYMSGHGGDGFIKFRDAEVLSAEDVADALRSMAIQRRYNELFFMLDTCQAGTLLETIDAPRVATIAASARGENSYSYGSDSTVGTSLVDKFTHLTMRYYGETGAQTSMKDLVSNTPLFPHSSLPTS